MKLRGWRTKDGYTIEVSAPGKKPRYLEVSKVLLAEHGTKVALLDGVIAELNCVMQLRTRPAAKIEAG